LLEKETTNKITKVETNIESERIEHLKNRENIKDIVWDEGFGVAGWFELLLLRMQEIDVLGQSHEE